MSGTLYIVATPIGHLAELSPRAVEVLSRVGVIACEDTRTSSVLLRHFGITTPTVSCHKFNEQTAAPRLIDRLLAGDDVALISDAGTPCISDPGQLLVQAAAEAGLTISPVAGPCAMVAALSVCGFATLSFAFYGFLPKERKKIKALFDRVDAADTAVAVFYLSPHRLDEPLSLLAERWPDASLCLCNDISKQHERVYRGTPTQVQAQLSANPNADKGEYTLVVQLPPRETSDDAPLSLEALLIDDWVRHGGRVKDAVARLSAAGTPKKALYDAALRLKELD